MTPAIRALSACALSILLTTCASRTAGPPSTADLVEVQLLAFNDFHGTLDPAGGSNGRMGQTPAGGVEFLATHLARLRSANPNTVIVSAGDNIGASTLMSAMFHDEPTIEALGQAGLQISTVGNHEFDEGWAELYRMQVGGCHPVDGCQDTTPFAGAPFQFLAANVVLDPSRLDRQQLAQTTWRVEGAGPQALFPAFTIKELSGVKVGFIGLVTESTRDLVPDLPGVTFRPEAEAGNEAVAALRAQGVRTIVVLIHEGGTPSTPDPNGCGVNGPIVGIVNELSDEVDVVVSGHTHRSYVCTIDSKLVTSAESLGRLITDIDLSIDRTTGDVVRKRASNVIVTREVERSAAETALIDHYRPFFAGLGERPVGTVTAPITRRQNAAGESALGGVVADAYLEAARAIDRTTILALMNPGGLRSDMNGRGGPSGDARTILFTDVFDTLPFGNRVIVRTLTGAALLQMLEQQFDNPDPGRAKILQVGGEFTYAYDSARRPGRRIDSASVRIGGRPLEASARYRVASNDFVWGGGDAFAAARLGTDPVDAGVDADALVAYFTRHSPVAPGAQNRIRSAAPSSR